MSQMCDPIINQRARSKKLLKSPRKSTNKLRVLLVEDNEINIHVATFLLNDYGIDDIIIAKNGTDALKYFLADVDLVILDIGLPDISGIDVCKQMRERLRGKSLPIIACSATDSLRSECLEAGCNDFILKPVTLDIFKEIVECFVPNVLA